MSKPDDHFFVVDGRRWRRTDPAVPEDVAAALRSHLGRGRNAVRQAKRSGDDAALAAARHRNGIAKHGLGERGPEWWGRPEPDRVADARRALADLDALDTPTDGDHRDAPDPGGSADAGATS